MGKVVYSRELCRSLLKRIDGIKLRVPYRLRRYEDGDLLELKMTTGWPERECKARFHVEKFVGGGFAGQVYRSRLESIEFEDGGDGGGLDVGELYAVKIMIPPSRFSSWFRDFVYKLAFQAPFSARVLKSACRSGLLWPKLLRVGAEDIFGDKEAIADTYATFYDDTFRAYGEVREWVEGRTWRLESDTNPQKRRKWYAIDPHDCESPEYVAKHQFMVKLVDTLHEMGSPELARQYEWTTMKSQPNALKRTSGGSDPVKGLCAVDFRAGLALVPYLPMSPGDFKLIFQGLMRGSLAQFDRCDFKKLRAYTDARPDVYGEHQDLIDALERYDSEYRRSMPDITHQGFKLLVDRELRADVRHGLVAGYWSDCLVDREMADKLEKGGIRFTVFYIIGAVPFLGRFVRKLWGNRDYRKHIGSLFSSLGYLRESGKFNAASAALDWHRAGRISVRHAELIADHVPLYWVERLSVSLLPVFMHRILCEPWRIWFGLRDGFKYTMRFFRDEAFREQWLREQIEDGYKEGMLHEDERDAILSQIKDPFIAKYLKSVGVHLATLPVTQIVSVIVGGIAAFKIYAATGSKAKASATFASIIFFFQVFPISPGSICRGLYVVYLMISERNFKDYMVAAPISFVKYIGYLAFPLQMATAYPEFSQFMAGRWATSVVHFIPVFGEKGALLEHFVFDMFFNYPRVLGRWAGRHIKGILDIWMLLGLGLAGYVFGIRGVDWSDPHGLKLGINVIMATVCLFILPRVLFYPVLHKRRKK